MTQNQHHLFLFFKKLTIRIPYEKPSVSQAGHTEHINNNCYNHANMKNAVAVEETVKITW